MEPISLRDMALRIMPRSSLNYRDGVPVIGVYYDGNWHSPTKNTTDDPVISPVDGKPVAYVTGLNSEEVDHAIDSAVQGQISMEALSGDDRLRLLDRVYNGMQGHRGSYIGILMAEAGKSEQDAGHEFDATLERLRLVMYEARTLFEGTYISDGWTKDTKNRVALVSRVPVGVVGIIGPFNYPLFIPAAKAIPALLAGNSVVLKPASATPLSMLMFARELELVGFPKGAFNVVTGSGKVVGNALVKSPKVSMISFTGSTEVGRTITKSAGLKKVQLELGGKGAAIVLEDADKSLAAKQIVQGALKNAGQRCDAVSLVLVQESIADELVNVIALEMAAFGAVGPLINIQAINHVQDLISDAVDKGAKVIGAHTLTSTLLDYVSRDAKIFTEEIFGPIIPIVRVKDEQEALEIHNASEYGLDSSIFTRDYQRALRLARKMKTGSVTLNDYPKHGLGLFPYGGVKASGLGREGIGYTVESMTELKTVILPSE